MDIYAIICMFTLVTQCIWHATIGAIIFLNTPDNRLTPSMWFTSLDHYVFFTVIGIFIIMHIALITWLYLVPFKHRKDMTKKDVQYRLSILNKKDGEDSQNVGKTSKKSIPFSRIPIGTDT
jgi:lysylphosphatidylglycerol synthetase-like protein (DUF2156 family)